MTIEYWIIGGMLIALIAIIFAVIRTGGSDDIDPYNGDGF